MKTCVTFGSDHRHEINGKVLDTNCVALVHGDRAKVFELFGPKFCMEYAEEHFDHSTLGKYYPRGIIEVVE